MKFPVLCLLGITLAYGLNVVCAQTLDPSRATDWSKAGYQGDRQPDYAVFDFTEHGGLADGVTPNDDALQALLHSLDGGAAIIYFPQGQYRFNQPIALRSNLILRGTALRKPNFALTSADRAT